MNESHDEKVYRSRFRSPTFCEKEVNILLKLVIKYRTIVFDKGSTTHASYKKDITWTNIAKEFNEQSKHIERSKDVLRTKWENLKKLAKKYRSGDDTGYRNVLMEVVAHLLNAENESGENEELQDLIKQVLSDNYESNHWNVDDFKTNNETEDNVPVQNENITKPFTPSEYRLLLKCAKMERLILFSNCPRLKKYQAWKRITTSFNRLSPTKRKLKELSIKFSSMKCYAKNVNKNKIYGNDSYRKFNRDDARTDLIKEEFDSDCDMDKSNTNNESFIDSDNINDYTSQENDPLGSNSDGNGNTVSSDSGIESVTDKDIIKLKMELLHYQLETAKLQHKRVQQAYESEKIEQEKRDLESSLKLRAARLVVVEAESKFSPSHPALTYLPEEEIIRQYLDRFKENPF